MPKLTSLHNEYMNLFARAPGNQFFEDKTHHSIRNFINGNNNDPIKETVHIKSHDHVPFVPLNPNRNYCRLNPDNPLCRRQKRKL